MAGYGKRLISVGLVALITPLMLVRAEPRDDLIDYVSGGLMSPHTELRLDLANGNYHLAEPKNAFGEVMPHDGRLSYERLTHLRDLTNRVVIDGFENEKCKHDKEFERRRSQRLAKRGVYTMPRFQSMDYQLSFWVTFTGKTASAPFDPGCWSKAGKALYDDMFEAVRGDAYLPSVNLPLIHLPSLNLPPLKTGG